jgi:hypothetical protein
MPEAYVECQELVAALRRHRPDWVLNAPSPEALRRFNSNRADWLDGFWKRARTSPSRQAGYNEDLGARRITAARQEVDTKRAHSRANNITLESVSLTNPELIDCLVDMANGESVRSQHWRVGAANHFVKELFKGDSEQRTYRDWLDPFLDGRRLLDRQALLAFWNEVEPTEVPTQWLFSAAGVLAPLVKVNDGTIFDIQLAAYLTAADVFVTADKNFARAAAVIADDAPFSTARPVRATPTEWLATLAGLAQS